MKTLLLCLSLCFCASSLAATQTEDRKSSQQEIFTYLSKVQAAISSQLVDREKYKGKTCELRLNLQRDGKVANVAPKNGDLALCGAAIKAIKSAKLPEPPNDEVYNLFKNAPILFKPE